jgi:hypothetical protein
LQFSAKAAIQTASMMFSILRRKVASDLAQTSGARVDIRGLYPNSIDLRRAQTSARRFVTVRERHHPRRRPSGGPRNHPHRDRGGPERHRPRSTSRAARPRRCARQRRSMCRPLVARAARRGEHRSSRTSPTCHRPRRYRQKNFLVHGTKIVCQILFFPGLIQMT